MSAATVAALERAHARQAAVLAPGERYAFPDLSDPRYYLVFLGRDRGGEVSGGLLFHATTEAFVIGDDPYFLRALVRNQALVARALCRAGADEAHAFVPRSMTGRMEPWLGRLGFRPSNPEFVPYYAEVPDGERR